MLGTIGVIGSGAIGSALARLGVAAGLRVVLSNSRGPESLGELVSDLGELARTADAAGAALLGDIMVVAVPLSSYDQRPRELSQARS